jgi:hypothetical protein
MIGSISISPADYGTLIAVTAARTKRMRRLKTFLCGRLRLALAEKRAKSAGASNSRALDPFPRHRQIPRFSNAHVDHLSIRVEAAGVPVIV